MKLRFAVSAVLFLLLIPVATHAFQFDPGGSIAGALNLPTEDTQSIVIKVIQYALSLLGLIAVILIIIGGFRYLTSGGNQEAITSAKAILRAAIIGLLIVMFSEAIFLIIIKFVAQVTS